MKTTRGSMTKAALSLALAPWMSATMPLAVSVTFTCVHLRGGTLSGGPAHAHILDRPALPALDSMRTMR
jgi:hypothetical protein